MNKLMMLLALVPAAQGLAINSIHNYYWNWQTNSTHLALWTQLNVNVVAQPNLCQWGCTVTLKRATTNQFIADMWFYWDYETSGGGDLPAQLWGFLPNNTGTRELLNGLHQMQNEKINIFFPGYTVNGFNGTLYARRTPVNCKTEENSDADFYCRIQNPHDTDVTIYNAAVKSVCNQVVDKYGNGGSQSYTSWYNCYGGQDCTKFRDNPADWYLAGYNAISQYTGLKGDRVVRSSNPDEGTFKCTATGSVDLSYGAFRVGKTAVARTQYMVIWDDESYDHFPEFTVA